jgi:endonuclease YncB( thermonuclease family)
VVLSLDRARRLLALRLGLEASDLGEWLVRNGLALDWPQYSKGKYASAQREADRLGRGMWAGSYVEPWLFRGCIRAGGTPANCSDNTNAHP